MAAQSTFSFPLQPAPLFAPSGAPSHGYFANVAATQLSTASFTGITTAAQTVSLATSTIPAAPAGSINLDVLQIENTGSASGLYVALAGLAGSLPANTPPQSWFVAPGQALTITNSLIPASTPSVTLRSDSLTTATLRRGYITQLAA